MQPPSDALRTDPRRRRRPRTKLRLLIALLALGSDTDFKAVGQQLVGAPARAVTTNVDLLQLLKLPSDSIRGNWSLTDGRLTGSGRNPADSPRVAVRCELPTEYEFAIRFLPTSKKSTVVQIVSDLQRQFVWNMSSDGSGFGLVDGRPATSNKTSSDFQLRAGETFTSTVKVRNKSVEAFVNGELVSRLDTDYSNLSLRPGWAIGEERNVGIGTIGAVDVLAATISEINAPYDATESDSATADRQVTNGLPPSRRRRSQLRGIPPAGARSASDASVQQETLDASLTTPDRRSYWMRSDPLDAVEFNRLAFSANGKYLAALTERPSVEDGVSRKFNDVETPILLWNADTGRRIMAPHTFDPLFELTFAGDDAGLLGTVYPNAARRSGPVGHLRYTPFMRIGQSGAPLLLALDPGGEDESLWNVAQTADGKQIVAATTSGLKVWDVDLLADAPRDGTALVPTSPTEALAQDRWLGPAAFSADASSCAVWTEDGSLEVWDVHRQTRTSAFKHERFSGLRPHAIRVASDNRVAALFFDKQRGEGSTVGIFADGKTGKVTDVIDEALADYLSLDLTHDGRFAATGGRDGSVHIWDAETGRQVAAFAASDRPIQQLAWSANNRLLAAATDAGVRVLDVSPSTGAGSHQHDPIPAERWLAGGALDVKIKTRKQEVAATLMKLTDQQLACRVTSTGKTFVFDPRGGAVQRIVAQDRDASWTWNAEKQSFDGPTLTADKPLPLEPTVNLDAEQAQLYLLLRVERMLQKAIALGLQGKRDAIGFDQLCAAASASSEIAAKNRFGEEVVELPGRVSELAASLQRESAQQARILRTEEIALRKLARQQERVESQSLFAGLTGLTATLIGAAPVSEYGWANDDGRLRQMVVNSEPLSPELSEWGIKSILNNRINTELRSNELKNLSQQVDSETRRDLEASSTRQSEAIADLQREIAAAISERIGGEPLLPLVLPHKAVDGVKLESMLDQIGRRGEQLRRAGGFDDPFIQANAILLQQLFEEKSLQPNALMDDALELARLAERVPVGGEYDFDRAELLALAGELAFRAAAIESGGKAWATEFNASAAQAARYFDQSLLYDPLDADGAVRESRAWALFLSGRLAEALQAAYDVEDLRYNSSQFHIQLARLASAMGRKAESGKELRIAVERLWFTDFAVLRNYPELNPLSKESRELLSLELELRPSAGLGGPPRVRVRNRSAVPVQDLRLDLRYDIEGTRAKSHSMQVTIPMLLPDEDQRVDLDPTFRPQRVGIDGISNFKAKFKSSRSGAGKVVVMESPGPTTVPTPWQRPARRKR